MTDPAPHHLPDTTTPGPPLAPTTLTPAAAAPAPEAAREPMVWIPAEGGMFAAVPRSLLPADYFTPSAPAVAEPAPAVRQGIDTRAQILAAGGLGIGAAGWGLSHLVSAMAGLGGAGLAALALALAVTRIPHTRRTTTDDGGHHTDIHLHRGARVRIKNLHHH